jgi:hypothetical protein
MGQTERQSLSDIRRSNSAFGNGGAEKLPPQYGMKLVPVPEMMTRERARHSPSAQ